MHVSGGYLYYNSYAMICMLNKIYDYGGCSYLPGAIKNDCKIKSFAIILPKFRTCLDLQNPLDNKKIIYAQHWTRVSKTTTQAYLDWQKSMSTLWTGNTGVQCSRQQHHWRDFKMVTSLSPGRSPCIEFTTLSPSIKVVIASDT